MTWGIAGVVLALAGAALALWVRPEASPPVIRQSLAFSASQAPVDFGNGTFGAGLTPDGSRLVYIGPGKADAQLWVWSFDQLRPVPIEGTQGVGDFSISTSGAWLGLLRGYRLSKMPLSGGYELTMPDSVPGWTSHTWLDDKTIVYTPYAIKDVPFALRTVSADGGASHAVPLKIIGHPVASTDGKILGSLPRSRGILLDSCSPGCAKVEVWVVDFESHEVHWLVDAASAWYVAGGYLVYVTVDGVVFAVPFNLRTLQITGSPVRLFDGVRAPDTNPQIGVSLNGTIWFVPGGPTTVRRELVWVNRDGAVSSVDSSWTFGSDGLAGFSLSPDGTQVAVTIGANLAEGIWIKQLPHGPVSRLTPDSAASFRPRWTGDGHSVTFATWSIGQDALIQPALHLRRSDGTGRDSVLLTAKAWQFQGFQTADRKWVVAGVGGIQGGRGQIVGKRTGPDTTVVRLVGDPAYDVFAPTLSPDGKWLAYMSNETNRYEVYVRPFPNVDSTKIPVSTDGGTAPLWAHSGRELFYLNLAGEMVVVAVSPGPPFHLQPPRTLFHLGKDLIRYERTYAWYDVTRDDQRFLMTRRVGSDTTDARSFVVIHNWLTELKAKMKGQ